MGEGTKEGTKAKAKFKKGQKVMVLYQDVNTGDPVYYAAEVKRSNKRPNAHGIPAHHYEVHFPGWGSKHDAWVEESEVTRFDKTLHGIALEGVGIPAAEFNLAPTGTLPAAAATFGAPLAGPPNSKKRKFPTEVPQELIPTLRLKMPALLKKVVVDDYECIMQKGLVLPLPRKTHRRPTVQQILDLFVKKISDANKDGENNDTEESADVAVKGLTDYFNKASIQFLLYGPETAFVEEALASSSSVKDEEPCKVFGAEHLVRLFVQLPALVPVMGQMEKNDVVALEARLHDLMAFMADSKNQAKFFSVVDEYIVNPFAPKTHDFNNLVLAPTRQESAAALDASLDQGGEGAGEVEEAKEQQV